MALVQDTTARPHIMVIDPAMRIAEVECFNHIALTSPLPVTYHLPAMYGLQSLAYADMRSARGLIILGSASSVHDRLPWQSALEDWLRPHLDAGLPTLGLCYGHQMLATMFGGRVAYVSPDQFKHKGLRRISVSATPCWPAGDGLVVVSHNETVADAPSCMRPIATSALIANDGLAHTQLPIWSFQSHPEATPAFLHNHAISTDEAPQAFAFGQSLVAGFVNFAAKTPV